MNKALKNLLIYTFLFGSLITTFYIIKNTHACACLNKLLFCEISTLDFTTEAARWTIVYALLARISLFLFAHAVMVMVIRIFAKKPNPATQEDPSSIKVLNRIITNTIEQSVIFIGLYLYFLFEKAGDRFNSTELMIFASWFLVARVFFSVGYMIGSLIGLTNLRAFGFALNFAINLLLIEICFCPVHHLTTYFFGK